MYQRKQRGKKNNESRTQYNRRPVQPGELTQQQFKSVSSGKVGGGKSLPPPSPSSSSSASRSSLVYRVVKKPSGEESQSRVPSASEESVTGHVQSDAPKQTSVSETSGAPTIDVAVKPTDTHVQEIIETVTNTQPSDSASGTSDSGAPKTPLRDNISKEVSLQFGSVSTGSVNELPAWPGSSKGVEYIPTAASKQPQPWEVSWQKNDPDRDPQPWPRKDLHSQVSAAPFHCMMQSSSFIPIPEDSVTMQGGFPGPQFQHPGMPFSSYQFPMSLPGGNTGQFLHQPFAPGFRPCPLPPQGMMLQAPLLNFPPMHDNQLHPQFGGVDVRVLPHHVERSPVKITHPETHEELILGEKVGAKLDSGTAGVPTHRRGDFQPQPFYFDARNFSDIQLNAFLESPTSVLPTNFQMPLDLPSPGQKSSGMCSVAASPKRELTSSLSTSAQVLEIPAEGSTGPVLANSSGVETLTRAMKPGSEHAESQIHSKFSTQQSTPSVQLSIPASCKTTGDSIPSNDAALREKDVSVNRERVQLKTPSETAPEHSEQCQNVGSALVSSEEHEHSKSAVSSGNAVSESKQPVSAHSLNSSQSTPFYKVKGISSEEVNRDHGSELNPNRVRSAFSKCREKRKENLKKADAVEANADSPLKKAPEISIQKLETSSKPEVAQHSLEDKAFFDGKKRYSRDFLLTLSSTITDLPMDFKLASDVAEKVLSSNGAVSRPVKHSPRGPSPHTAKTVSRSTGISQLEYRAVGATDNVKWIKPDAALASVSNQSVNNSEIRQRRNYGAVRNLQVPLSNQNASSFSPGRRNSRSGNKSQRSSRSIKSPVPSPQSPLQFMHKAEKKYEVRKVSDVEEGKQRQLKAILNKLTPQNFERLFQQVKEVAIDNAVTLSGVISQIFDKALMELTFCEMYADFCYHLANELPDFVEDDQKITFKRLLLNKCQEEFERGEREQAEAEFKQSDQEREAKRVQARRRMLGNIRLIGELYKNKMLTERIMHECIHKLLGQDLNPYEEDIEALCNLMCTIGEMIDHDKAKCQMDTYFETLSRLSNNPDLSSRLRFMLMDVIDLRKNYWQKRRKVEGPKKIEELHRDVHQERQAQTGRFTGAPINFPSPRRGQPSDIDSPATLISPIPQVDTAHRMPSYIHGLGSQDDKQSHESVYGLRGEPISRSKQGDVLYASRDAANLSRSYGRSGELSSPAHLQSNPVASNSHAEKVLSGGCLAELSISAIREFYSAVDENEVVLCIRELSSPNFLPKLVSLWVNDSFERKDRDRVLLAKLLVNLTKSRGILDPKQLIEGFESVLATLEDAITDAPKAAAFLGSVFGTMIIEDVISLEKIAHLVRESSEKSGHLKTGLAHVVLESTFKMIKSEKGESYLRDICKSSNIELDNFAPLKPPK